jgi:glycosyltransferase involved in cell wall biosynthesis
MTVTKKIAVLCNYRLMPERVGGMDRFYWLFDTECKRLGYEVIWVFPNQGTHGQYDKLTIVPADNQSVEDFFIDYIRQNQAAFDVVITHFLELCTPFFEKLKKNSLCKVIVVDHNARPIEGYPLKKRIQKKIKGILFSKYIDVFVAVSEYTRGLLIKDFGNQIKPKITLIYNGIDVQLYKKREVRNYNKPTFLVASNLGYPKGIQDLIASVNDLQDDIKSEIKIDVYGTGGYETQLRNLVDKYNLNNTIFFKGSRPNLFEVYYQYDYLLQPTHMECFSLSVLESLSANVPVVTTSVGGNEEVIKNGENGFIFPPKDTNQLKAILEDIFIGKQVITQNTSSLIEEAFSIEKMVQQHISIL